VSVPCLRHFALIPVLLSATAFGEVPNKPRVLGIALSAPQEAAEIRIRPDLLTTLLFSPRLKLARIDLEKKEQFLRVNLLPDALLILPSRGLAVGERLRLRAYFADVLAPRSADFVLVVNAEDAEQQVNVDVMPRAMDSHEQELEAQRAELRQCRAALTQARRPLDGLTGLLASGRLDAQGVASRHLGLERSFARNDVDKLLVRFATSYRARGVVALELRVENRSGHDWTAAGAELTSATGERLKVLRVWPTEPLLSGPQVQRVVVEAEATTEKGPFTLQLWEEDRAPSITLRGLTFPEAPSTHQ
jgi:uncharacterized protein (TIGR02268 family)